MKKIIFLLFILCPVAHAYDMPYTLYDRNGNLSKLNLIGTVQDIYVKLSNGVDKYSNQTIAGNNTFSGNTTLSGSTTVNGTLTVNTNPTLSSATVTNTLTANEVTTTYGFYHDRGDVAGSGADYNSLTATSWTDLDLSAIVPAGAKAVCLRVKIAYTEAGKNVYFRKNGYSGSHNLSQITTQVVNVAICTDLIIPCDTDRVIEYLFDAGSITAEAITVKGWWK